MGRKIKMKEEERNATKNDDERKEKETGDLDIQSHISSKVNQHFKYRRKKRKITLHFIDMFNFCKSNYRL